MELIIAVYGSMKRLKGAIEIRKMLITKPFKNITALSSISYFIFFKTVKVSKCRFKIQKKYRCEHKIEKSMTPDTQCSADLRNYCILPNGV